MTRNNPAPLSEVLQASLDYIREKRRQQEDSLTPWLDAIPPPRPPRPKKLPRKKMTQAIELSEPRTLVVHRDVSAPLEFTPQQCAMIRDTYAMGASEKEFQVLMEVAKVRRLNPLLRQVHFVKRRDYQRDKDIWSVQVSVDGLRAIAERTGKYDGQDEPEYERDKEGLIIACRVKVYRKDWTRPAIGVAYWSEYVQTKKDGSPTKFWADMPHVMIAKCAEAIAMRKAFPEDMGGLYVDEEMQQAENGREHHGQALGNNVHLAPGQDPDALPTDGGESGNRMLSRLVELETDVDACDSYEKMLTCRALLGGNGCPPVITKGLSEKIQTGEISPAQQSAIGKIAQRLNRKLIKLESKLKPPPVESSFVDEPNDDTAAFAPTREPGDDSDEETL